MDFLTQLLLENKLLLLFLVIALGYFIGRVNIGGISLGVSAVLFVGILLGSLHPEMYLPDIVYSIGLVLFVYTIGLRSGGSFFASFKKSGWRDNISVLLILILSAFVTLGIGKLLGIKNTLIAGVFCGSLTNTPALASVIDVLKHDTLNLTHEALSQLLSEPVVGYSLTYPMGVIGIIVGLQLGMKIWKIDMKTEQMATKEVTGIDHEPVGKVNVLVTNPAVFGKTIDEIEALHHLDLVVSRLKNKEGKIIIPDETKDQLQEGDIITLISTTSQLEKQIPIFGTVTQEDLSLQRDEIDYRRIFVSNPRVVGKKIYQLRLYERFQAVITRLRRGDIDLVVNDHMVLEAGDRVRVTAPKENMNAVSKFLGDSLQHLSEVDYISISLGITLGLTVGMIPIPLPNGTHFKLGFAAGTLLVALILGRLGRTRNIVWGMSYNANLTLRQVGVVLFLAGIGLKAGYSFASTFQETGFQLVLFGMFNTLFTVSITLLLMRLVYKMPYNLIMGIIAALHTQPACLAYANEQDKTGAANISYATVYPTAMITKILLAQWLL